MSCASGWGNALEHARARAHLNISMMAARVRRKHGLKPHHLERYMASNDPDFEANAAGIIGLYLNPPAHAAVFCVGEKTAIRVLDRKDPVLPSSPRRAERHGFEYYQHGTLSLQAALNITTGDVLGRPLPDTPPRSLSQSAARQRHPCDRRQSLGSQDKDKAKNFCRCTATFIRT